MLPLTGITVVALEQAVAAPFATRQLADLGARVIKIERPDAGDFARHYDQAVNGLSSHFVWLNRGKESLTLDLKQPQAQTIMHQLLATADVFIQNLAPQASQRLGFGAETLRSANPKLIVCDISGYGSNGPYQHKKAYDLLIQCEAGAVAITGSADQPAKVGIPIADIAGGMYAYTGILTALYQRQATGEGCQIEVALFEALAEWMGFPAYYSGYSGQNLPRTGVQHAAIAPYGAFDCADGQVFLAVQNQREWQQFCSGFLRQPALIEQPAFATVSQRVANRQALEALINQHTRELNLDQTLAQLDALGIANARLNSVLDFWQHPQLAARGRWRSVMSEVGPIQALLPPVNWSNVTPAMQGIPALGAATQAILHELGYTQAEIDGFKAQAVI